MTDDGFKKTHKDVELTKELSEARFAEFRKSGGMLPCQFVPSSYFFHRLWIWSDPEDVNDMYAVADICATCPLKEECKVLGKDEPCGIWGGEYRMYWVERKDLFNGRLPYC